MPAYLKACRRSDARLRPFHRCDSSGSGESRELLGCWIRQLRRWSKALRASSARINWKVTCRKKSPTSSRPDCSALNCDGCRTHLKLQIRLPLEAGTSYH
ncbi:hypothetical protein Mp_1g20300 [Marchantia polymorpha subsp. ruderalis]|uniref:Uncharacterized protein n=2 Tax=Marchantia polymorpha TaxID=3197 RepID=A0AAF6AS79_MARPO|nr:hypothetical protein MARPO_0001s0367 [Marchantia polymorpha]BBM99299.1 hypothetical protein Mp_1g20300 [Marchantia polymorpha subsp. ruderalis]|eukprot:PTQ50381.1 hypothetical protein MARPO_0001s0367 [Marchantia polymorpha]